MNDKSISHRFDVNAGVNSGPAASAEALPGLRSAQLYRRADLSNLPFATSADIAPIEELVGQARASEAIRFGGQIDKPGFNLFVIGPDGAAMRQAVTKSLRTQARARPSPPDWVYVHNFGNPDKPIAIELPAGRAPAFRDAMHELVEDLKTAIPTAFQSDDYQSRRAAIDEVFQKKQGEVFAALREKAAEKDVVILRTPFGFALAPAEQGRVVPPDEFSAWPEERRNQVHATIQSLEADLEQAIRQLPRLEKERRDEIRALNRETVKFAVDQLLDECKGPFADLPKVGEHIEAVRTDIVENIAIAVGKGEAGEGDGAEAKTGSLDHYEVNILVTQAEGVPGAPVVEELHPTLGNLIGRIEYVSQRGVLVTNFRLIKAGALHRANGGYLLLDVRSLLSEPFSWTALKRTLRRGRIAIEDVARFLGLTSTVSLDPDPIPLNLKIVLFGDRLLYFLLAALDPETGDYFKVLADFESDFERTPQNEAVLVRLMATMIKSAGLRPFDRPAMVLLLEHAARLADHAGKLTLVIDRLKDVAIEADFIAGAAGRDVVAVADVEAALAARIQRAARLRDRTQEAILQNVALIDTAGQRVGQINGLSVLELGGFAFGRPTRITCQVRPGSGRVVDIEREVELGGPIHSKGVLILSGYLAGRFALDTPMSLFASLVFEQSYGGVEGDSASSAELYALLSALADVPLRQDLAVTGSVDQHGRVQAVGGVNEKIEGFFDICNLRGLTGSQGVLIPQANVQNLMLRKDVVNACAEGRFTIYPVATIEQGIALLTGLEAGQRGNDGNYPADSVNRRVEERLRSFATIRRSFGQQAEAALPRK